MSHCVPCAWALGNTEDESDGAVVLVTRFGTWVLG